MNAFHIEQLEPQTPGANPFTEDRFHMGTTLGKNLVAMHRHFPEKDDAGYIILVHLPTGQRIKVTFPEDNPKAIDGSIMSYLMGGTV